MSKIARKKKDIEFSQEEFDSFLDDLSDFDDKSYEILAETDMYEIIPTMDSNGNILTQKELSVLRMECRRLGCAVLYRVDRENGDTVLLNPETGKTMLLKEGMQ